MTPHVISNVANFKRILVVQVSCAKAFVACICCVLHKGFCRAEDVVTQKMSLRKGCHHIEDVAAHKISLHRGCCHKENVTMQKMSSRRGYHCGKDLVA
jgi:hypothetical protein